MKRYLLFLGFAFALIPQNVWGEMSSASYSIYSDVIGVSGVEISTSTTYTLSDTVGEMGALVSASSTYYVTGGYQSMVRGSISFSLTSSSLNLGILNSSAVNSAAAVATVNSDDSGYTLSIYNVSSSIPFTVADGAVTAGSDEYGLSVSGSNASVSGDVAATNGLLLVSSPTPILNDQSTITFKASTAGSATPGAYNQTIDLIVAAFY